MRPKITETEKERLTIYLTPAASEKLRIHATLLRMDISSLTEQLVNEHLNQYEVTEVKSHARARQKATP